MENILNNVAKGETKPEEAMALLKDLPFESLDFAHIDEHRNLRKGYPETIFCEGKTPEQTAAIFAAMVKRNSNVMGTRASRETFEKVKEAVPEAVYYEAARIVAVHGNHEILSEKPIAVVTAGTSDIPVAEEAAITAELLGNQVERIYDVGVAGIHRLFSKLDQLRQANVVIVVAGMEGALASVVGGLVDKPVVAVPTSVGYGASFGGVAALLTMLNSCATGVGVVNIDNGFGAACLASSINQL